MKVKLSCAVVLIQLQVSESFNLLRHQIIELTNTNQPRQLNSVVGGIEISGGNTRYDNYDGSEVPTDRSMNDAPDFLRSDDVCLKDGSISSGNCPSVPNCNFNGQFGQAKLCINRLPTPAGNWYVAAMVCIPQWENCDKCMCGKITSDTAADAKCAFTGQTPNDDNVEVNCGDLRTSKIDGISLSTPGDQKDSSETSSTTTITQAKSGMVSDFSPPKEGEKESPGTSEQSDDAIQQSDDTSEQSTSPDDHSSSVSTTDKEELSQDSDLGEKKTHPKIGQSRRNK